jgi:hypothetical protein
MRMMDVVVSLPGLVSTSRAVLAELRISRYRGRERRIGGDQPVCIDVNASASIRLVGRQVCRRHVTVSRGVR